MKNSIVLCFSVLLLGSIFQSCDNTKTYAEMLSDEREAVSRLIKDRGITVISKDEFEKDTITDLKKNEYVLFSNGVYMQIADRGGKAESGGEINKVDTFATNDNICVRYVEENIALGDTTTLNVFIPGLSDMHPEWYALPAVFRYVVENESSYGTFIEMSYLWASVYGSTAVPSGWLLALPYLRNNSHVRLIVPSKMGHNSAQQYVQPYYYDIWSFSKAQN
ncbi:MAG: DUF4827 domain-containing protein [Bacteroidia bacterium]|nr:DUF4827 domain-containing protein [Bacteroidia bacterium]